MKNSNNKNQYSVKLLLFCAQNLCFSIVSSSPMATWSQLITFLFNFNQLNL